MAIRTVVKPTLPLREDIDLTRPIYDQVVRASHDGTKRKKKRISIYLDDDVLAAFRKTGRDWQPRINDALRASLGL